MVEIDIDRVKEEAWDRYQASISDPECCELCGGWLGDEPRYEKGRAHLDCVHQEWADWESGE